MRFWLEAYWRLISIRIRSQLQYRVSFILDTLATALTVVVEFGSLVLIMNRFESIGGWDLPEVALLYGMVTFAFGTMDMTFSGFDPQNFGQQVRRGTFDQLLLKPLPMTLQVLGSEFVIRRLGRIIQGIAILVFALVQLNIAWTPQKILFIPLIYVSQVAFFGGLFIVGATISFWTVEALETVNVFTYGGTELISYPMHIYQDWIRYFFTFVLPAIFLNYYPVLYILGKPDPFHMPSIAPFLAPGVGVGVLLVSLAFWRFGIRHYQSTGT